MKKLIAAVVTFTGAWMGLGTGVAHADNGQPWVCAAVDSVNLTACLANPLPDHLPFI